jgi:hypothetical protein
MEEERALAEQKLKEKHDNKISNFQFMVGQKCWHMITKAWRSHQVMRCSDVRAKGEGRTCRVVHQMTLLLVVCSLHDIVMNTLCTPNQSKQEVTQATFVTNEEGRIAKCLYPSLFCGYEVANYGVTYII